MIYAIVLSENGTKLNLICKFFLVSVYKTFISDNTIVISEELYLKIDKDIK